MGVTTVDKKLEVDAPVERVYNQWTQFEDFPRFMEGVKEVHQQGDERLHWRADVNGKDKEWYARITRQVPDEVIAWESEGGANNAGTVIFKPLSPERTELEVHMQYETEDFTEAVGGALGFLSRRVDNDLKHFKEFIENRGQETGAWRGEIMHGAPEGSQLHTAEYDRGRDGHGDGMADDDHPQQGGLKEPGQGRSI
jgi:uncharacterized membrane protein